MQALPYQLCAINLFSAPTQLTNECYTDFSRKGNVIIAHITWRPV
jgi:hypothetical protein